MSEPILRTELTRSIISELESFRCINLISPHGQGRRRTLQDIESLLPGGWLLLKVDIKAIQPDKDGLLACLCEQAKLNHVIDFKCLFSALAEKTSRVLIIIHNFDLLNDSNVCLALNDMYQYEQLMLLTVSVSEHVDTGIKNMKLCLIPDLTAEQLHCELKRRLPNVSTAMLEAKLAELMRQALPYNSLDKL